MHASLVLRSTLTATQPRVSHSPGRFYAAAVMKVILVQIILDYDFRLADPSAPRWFTWRSSMLPRKATRVIFEFRPWLGSIRIYSYGEGC